MLKNNLGRLRLLGFLEGISFILLLGVGMPLKYMADMPVPNQVIGMAHGVLFLLYCAWVFVVKDELKWGLPKTIWALLASLVPFGTFVADVRLFRESK